MKKVVVCVMGIIMSLIVALSATGCNKNNDDDNKSNEDSKTYTLQYATESGTYQLTVTQGQPYFMENIPTKTGYNFMGLYDSEVGGTQYVTANGSSVSPYTDGKSLVLYPQWKAKEYTLMLDYQGATVAGERSVKVSYGATLPELPKNLNFEHCEFAGWYTQAGCQGTQVADEYGIIPDKAIVDEDIFDLSNKNGFIYLYAGFEAEKYSVTFCFESGMDTEEIKVAYNTPINQVVPETRVDDKAVFAWSKTQGGEAWNGNVTGDIVLYAVEYAPVIDLDSNGGSSVKPVVARAGSTIALPTPTKDLAKFSHWEDASGNEFTSTVMPTSSTSLKAVWQAKIVFDVNGGNEVSEISQKAGTKITLPLTEKEGFIFAGWYTADKQQYTDTTMPLNGFCLKAGWYKCKSDTVTVSCHYNEWSSELMAQLYKFDFSRFFERGKVVNFTVEFSVKIRLNYNANVDGFVDFFNKAEISSANLIGTHNLSNITNVAKVYSFSKTFTAKDDFYIRFYSTSEKIYLQDFYYTVQYPDTTNLYL